MEIALRLAAVGAMPACVAEFLAGAVKSRVSTVISGGTGSGKTTLLNTMTAFIDPTEMGRFVAASEKAFNIELARQQGAAK